MSNEKPVRITVGDVKEVTEATSIQTEQFAGTSVPAVSSHASPTIDSSGNGMVMGAGLFGVILLILAGYYGLVHGVTGTTPAPTIAPTSGTNPMSPEAISASPSTTKGSSSTNVPAK
jgi:hypothetical protein